MALVRATQHAGKYASLGRSLSKVLDTVTEIKQKRGEQAMNAAVLKAVGALPQGASSSQRMGAASGAAQDVRAGQGSQGLLHNIMSIFNPNVATYPGGSTPIEGMLAEAAVNDMTSRADYYRQAQEQSQKDLMAQLVQAEKSWVQAQKNITDYRAARSTEAKPVDEGYIAKLESRLNYWGERGDTIRLQLSGRPKPLGPSDSPNAMKIGAEITAARRAAPPISTVAPGPVGSPVGLMTPSQSPTGPAVGPLSSAAPVTQPTLELITQLVGSLENDIPEIWQLFQTNQDEIMQVIAAIESGALTREEAVEIIKQSQAK